MHQSFGQDYKTVAACQLVFKDIFDKPHGRIHGTATLIGNNMLVRLKVVEELLVEKD